jgi:hypothetical protein
MKGERTTGSLARWRAEVHLMRNVRIFGGSSSWGGQSVKPATSPSCYPVVCNARATSSSADLKKIRLKVLLNLTTQRNRTILLADIFFIF